MSDLWSFKAEGWADGRDVVGYDVAATDGDIGKIDEATTTADNQHLVVDTGFWIFGKKRLIPAGAITRIDHEGQRVHVNMTKDQIKQAPDFDEAGRDDADFRTRHDEYYRPYGADRPIT